MLNLRAGGYAVRVVLIVAGKDVATALQSISELPLPYTGHRALCQAAVWAASAIRATGQSRMLAERGAREVTLGLGCKGEDVEQRP